MLLSIIIPAFNEAHLIRQCLDSISASLNANQRADFTSEVIVVDNNSTDETAKLARQSGAHVVFEPINQIGRARNTGAAAATGDWFLFVDADSLLNPGMIADILQLIGSGKYVGCGSVMQMPNSPWWGTAILKVWTGVSVTFRWASGALVVCRADAFRAVGGFNQNLYAADEIDLSHLLKKWGRKRGLKFTILTRHPLITSARKLELYSGREMASQFFQVLLSPRKALQNKKKLPVWYDGRR
ncbi:Glycosyl transferase family 2 [Nitrosomonas aestuarii]|uniref:Glycosyl transferase family 2 n=1 Tax=Nitrosomonas aestuarii TaxID=52441 RepID=A0A1I4FEK1_9PROT|nr:glycosyltransferase [Nitrosomonas aestuarii]SFL15919.1 Glycosyl transferase family 2 [Nitrosomonas aestuarii]